MNQSYLRTGTVFCLPVLLACLVNPVLFAEERSQTTTVAAIERLGGSARFIEGAWEVSFAIRGQRLTDADLVHVTGLRPLALLNLKGTRITSKGLKRLAQLSSLQVLNLGNTSITDEGLQQLTTLPKLEILNLYATRVSDRGLDRLAECRMLKKLYVWNTEVSEDGVRRLKQRLPKLKVVRGVDLKTLASTFSEQPTKAVPRIRLDWVPIQARSEAPNRSESGVNCEILFENRSKQSVKLYWIMYGDGGLRLYATLKPGEMRRQNSYSRNAWLIADSADRPIGYFIVKQEDSHAIIPAP